MEKDFSSKNSSRRDLLRYAGMAGFVGFTGFTGLKFNSKPAIAAPTGAPKIVNGITPGEHPVSPYNIEYQNLDTTQPITITYIFTDSNENETKTSHSVSLSGEPENGTVSTGSHTVTVPSGDIQLGIEVSHPSLPSTLSTSSSSEYTVFEALPVAYSNLLAWYPFDSATYGGSNADDVTAIVGGSGDDTAYNGTVSGATYQSSSGVTDIRSDGNSGTFSFNDDEISLPNMGLDGFRDLTVTAWIKTNDVSGVQIVFSFGDSGSSDQTMSFGLKNGDIETFYWSNDLRTDHNFSNGTYNHIAMVQNAQTNELRHFANGQFNGSRIMGTASWNDNDYYIGRNNNDGDRRPVVGELDGVRVYDSVLSDSQIEQIYQNTEP